MIQLDIKELELMKPMDRLKAIVEAINGLNRAVNALQTHTKPIKEPGKRFVEPTVKEVEDYGLSIGFKIDGEQFIAHYRASNWMRGNTKIRDWKQCVVTWKKNGNSNGFTSTPTIEEKPKFKIIKTICDNCQVEQDTELNVANRWNLSICNCIKCKTPMLRQL